MCNLDKLDRNVTAALNLSADMLDTAAENHEYEPLLTVIVHLCAVNLAVNMEQARLLAQLVEGQR